MGDYTKQWTIWEFVGGVSAISGFSCFPFSSTYKMSFGKLGIHGLLSYLLVCLITGCLILLAKRISVPEKVRISVSEKVKGVVGAIFFIVINSISVVHDKYVPGKSDAFTIISYGSFALMSVSLSRNLELGFETGFSAFFLQLFAAQLYKIKWFLLPIALVFSSLVIVLRHYPEESKVPQVQVSRERCISNFNTIQDYARGKAPMHYPSLAGVPPCYQTASIYYGNSQDISPSQAVSDGLIRKWWQESLYYSEQDCGSSANDQNGHAHGSPPLQLLRNEDSPLEDHMAVDFGYKKTHRSVRRRITPAVQNVPNQP